MSSVHTLATGTFTPSVTVPADGDAPTAASVNVSIEAVADNTGYLEDKAFYGVEGYIHVPIGLSMMNPNARWAWNTTLWAWVQVDDTDAGELRWPVTTPIKGRIREVLAEIDGNAGPGAASHAALPDTMPIITLYRIEYSVGGAEVTQIGATADPAISAAEYDLPHTFGPVLVEDISATRSYFVKFEGETGANSLPDELLLADIRIKLEAAP